MRSNEAAKIAKRMAELEEIRLQREAEGRRQDVVVDRHCSMPLIPSVQSQAIRVESDDQSRDNDKLTRKRHQQANNSRRYYHKHRAEIQLRVKERRVRQANKLQDIPEDERNSVLEAKRRKQREYSRKHREANRSTINERERARRKRIR
ncbi:hypothetical protein VNI00_018038 [Paramarasmius palmivorus]|uniref:Uncharacterized protein n=1 Tax=Paramarasmius palmivorus TaxID=297713 RepID=A0AAW0B281_9AGAR